MKKIFFGMLCLASSATFAAGTAVCASPTASQASTVTVTADGTTFVKEAFKPKCSANVHLAYEQNGVNFAAAGASSKGKSVFGGHTGGGGVSSVGACARTSCGASDATGATEALLTAAAAS